MTDQQPEALRLANDAMCRLPGNDGAEIAAELRRLHADLDANAAAFDREREERIKAQAEAKTLSAMLERLQAGGQGLGPLELALCESKRLVLREGVTYRFVRVGECETCAAMSRASSEAYGDAPAHPPAAPDHVPDADKMTAAPAPAPKAALMQDLRDYIDGHTAGMEDGRALAAPALVPLPADRIVNPYIHSKGAASVWLSGFRAGERAHGINGLTVGGHGGAKV